MNLLEQLLEQAAKLDPSQFFEPKMPLPEDEEIKEVGEMSEAARRLFTLYMQMGDELKAIHTEGNEALSGHDLHKERLEDVLLPDLRMRDELAHIREELLGKLFWMQIHLDHSEALCGKARIAVCQGFKVIYYVNDEESENPLARMMRLGDGLEIEVISVSGPFFRDPFEDLFRRLQRR
jgi:hypothetical protein